MPQAPLSLHTDPPVAMIASPTVHNAQGTSAVSMMKLTPCNVHVIFLAVASAGVGGSMTRGWRLAPGIKWPASKRPEIGMASSGKVVVVDCLE